MSLVSLRAWAYRHLRQVRVAALLLPLVVLGVSLFGPSHPPVQAASAASIDFVSPEWVNEHINDENLRVLDVRFSPIAYFQGHIPGAVHLPDNLFRGPNGTLPVQYWDNDRLADTFRRAGVTDDSAVLIYADGNEVLGSTMVAYLLERSGHSAHVLDGGLKAYVDGGFATSQEFPQYTPGTFTWNDDTSVRVSLEQVREFVGNGEATFIDPRPADFFAGELNVFSRNGHIPGSRNIPWPTFTIGDDNQHALKPLDEIQALLDEKGISKDDDIVITCTTGREVTLQYAVMKHLLGYPNVRVYEGSWTEYHTTDLPVATGRDEA